MHIRRRKVKRAVGWNFGVPALAESHAAYFGKTSPMHDGGIALKFVD
ncbi:hypothetical protein HUU05_05085 [candidate division KSB1 bacterium]|nr:hypothetical protein [candidate division KSB1 bacterium]